MAHACPDCNERCTCDDDHDDILDNTACTHCKDEKEELLYCPICGMDECICSVY